MGCCRERDGEGEGGEEEDGEAGGEGSDTGDSPSDDGTEQDDEGKGKAEATTGENVPEEVADPYPCYFHGLMGWKCPLKVR